MNTTWLWRRGQRSIGIGSYCGAAAKAGIEPLEGRTLLAFAELEADGTLLVTGTPEFDHLTLESTWNQIVVKLGTEVARFDRGSVRDVDVRALAGEDTVYVMGGVPGGVIELGPDRNSLLINGDDHDGTFRVVLGHQGDGVNLGPDAVASVVVETRRPAAWGHVSFSGTDGDDTIIASPTQITRGLTRVSYDNPVSIGIYAGDGDDTVLLAGRTTAEYQYYDGGEGEDLLHVVGTDLDDVVQFDAIAEDMNFAYGVPGWERDFDRYIVDGGRGDDELRVGRILRSQPVFQRGGGGRDKLTVLHTTWYFRQNEVDLDVAAWGRGALLYLLETQQLNSLELRDGAGAQVGWSLAVKSLEMDEGSVLDVSNGDLFIDTTLTNREAVLEWVTARVAEGRNGDPERTWRWNGITTMATDIEPLMGLAAVFAGYDDVAVRYTYEGDANADGKVNADDYFRIDQGFLAQPAKPVYAQGDFNYDGRVNADDYFLIDRSFLGQGGTTQSAVAEAPRLAEAEAERVTKRVKAVRAEGVFSEERVGGRRGVQRRARAGR